MVSSLKSMRWDWDLKGRVTVTTTGGQSWTFCPDALPRRGMVLQHPVALGVDDGRDLAIAGQPGVIADTSGGTRPAAQSDEAPVAPIGLTAK